MGLTVGYDATAAANQAAGIGRYARELLFALSRLPDPIEYRVYYCARGASRGHMPALDGRSRSRAIPASDRVMNALWHRARLPLPVQLFTGRIDVFHSPDFTLPPTLATPAVLTVHDLAFLTQPECAYPTLRAYLDRVVPRSIEKADHVIAVSRSTADDLQRLLGVPQDSISVVMEGVSPLFAPISDVPAAQRRLDALGVPGPFILTVGTIEPRKNYARLFEAYAAMRTRGITETLVVAGRPGWLYEPVLARLAELGLEKHVLFLTPPDEVLPALYGLSALFVFPSLYEGFGIPPLEALACGAVVACSNSSSMPEVVGDAAALFDPLDVPQMAETITRALRDDGLRRDLRRRGPLRARRFTWDRAARQTADIYQRVAASA